MESHTEVLPISDADLARVREWKCDDKDCHNAHSHFTLQAMHAVIARLDAAEAENEFLKRPNKNYEELKLPAALAALQDCIDTAAELRRNISPDQGCGYRLYRTVWDASLAAEIRAKLILAQLT